MFLDFCWFFLEIVSSPRKTPPRRTPEEAPGGDPKKPPRMFHGVNTVNTVKSVNTVENVQCRSPPPCAQETAAHNAAHILHISGPSWASGRVSGRLKQC